MQVYLVNTLQYKRCEPARKLIAKVADPMVAVEGESLRGVSWVGINEFAGGLWVIGGKALQASNVLALAATK